MGHVMELFNLSGPDFLNPFWFNQIRYGEHEATVNELGHVILQGETLRFKVGALPTGTRVRVWLNQAGFFVCATEAELEKRVALQKEAEAARAQAQRVRWEALQREAQAFNARIQLPVKWTGGIKDVLSGLSESSNGDGRRQNTVVHVYLLEPLQAGRLKRQAGDFLCSSSAEHNGKRWSGEVEYSKEHHKVSCKACLALAARWMSADDVR